METKSNFTKPEKAQLVRKMAVRFTVIPVFIGLTVLVPAGTFDYWQFYAYLATIILPMLLVLFYFLKKDPKFLERRLRSKEKEKAQKVIQIVFSIFFLAIFVVSGLDKRFVWSNIPNELVIATDLIVLAGYYIIFKVFQQNSYASRIVEVEENQQVISTGIYAWVRHPMYVGVIIMYLPVPIALGSWWALIPAISIPLGLDRKSVV